MSPASASLARTVTIDDPRIQLITIWSLGRLLMKNSRMKKLEVRDKIFVRFFHRFLTVFFLDSAFFFGFYQNLMAFWHPTSRFSVRLDFTQVILKIKTIQLFMETQCISKIRNTFLTVFSQSHSPMYFDFKYKARNRNCPPFTIVEGGHFRFRALFVVRLREQYCATT